MTSHLHSRGSVSDGSGDVQEQESLLRSDLIRAQPGLHQPLVEPAGIQAMVKAAALDSQKISAGSCTKIN